MFCTENRLFGEYFDAVQDDGTNRPRLRVTLDEYVNSLGTHYNWQELDVPWEETRRRLIESFIHSLNDVSRELSKKPVVVDKITPYIDTSDRVVESIETHFPEARIIHLVRDGRDVLTSGVFHWLTKRTGGGSHEMARLRRAVFVEKDPTVRLTRMFDDRDIDHWATTWAQPIEAVERLAARREVLTISYEEMVRNIAEVLSRVFRFLEVDSTEEILGACTERASFESMSGGRTRGTEDPTAHVRKGVVEREVGG